MQDDRYEVCFSGSGGQGIITAASVLAEAVGIYEDKFVCQTQSYGPEARGGITRAEIVISNKSIDYPKIIKMDLLLVMNQASCDSFFWELKHEGLLIVDSGLVTQIPTSRYIGIPFTRIARNKIGNELVANMVALGAVAFLSGKVSIKSLRKALITKLPKTTLKMNLKGLLIGTKAAQEVDITSIPKSVSTEDEDL